MAGDERDQMELREPRWLYPSNFQCETGGSPSSSKTLGIVGLAMTLRCSVMRSPASRGGTPGNQPATRTSGKGSMKQLKSLLRMGEDGVDRL